MSVEIMHREIKEQLKLSLKHCSHCYSMLSFYDEDLPLYPLNKLYLAKRGWSSLSISHLANCFSSFMRVCCSILRLLVIG